MDNLQELAAASTLNNSVIVGRGKGDDFANTQFRKLGITHSLELSWILKSTRTYDATLTFGQAWNRVHGANSTRVSKRNRRSLEITCGEGVSSCLRDQVFISGEILGEVQALSSLDVWNQ